MSYARKTNQLTKSQLDKLFGAHKHAIDTDTPFNTAITVNWVSVSGIGGNISHDDAQKRRAAMLRCCRQWMERRGVTWAAAWTMENGTSKKGLHCHIAAHIPAGIRNDFEHFLRVHLAAEFDDALDVKEADYPRGWLKYMAKDATKPARRRYGIRYCGEQGLVIGKRYGISQSLGPAAIAQYNETRRRHTVAAA